MEKKIDVEIGNLLAPREGPGNMYILYVLIIGPENIYCIYMFIISTILWYRHFNSSLLQSYKERTIIFIMIKE